MKSGLDFGYYINADDIARERGLHGDAGSRDAQAVADTQREECLRGLRDFSFETVMSHESKIDFMRRACIAGFRTTLYFVATGDPLLNVDRVKIRVALDGHDVPHDRILARYHRTLALLPSAILTADETFVFDNSADGKSSGQKTGLRPILHGKKSNFTDGPDTLTFRILRPFPVWATAAFHMGQLGYELMECHHISDGASAVFFQRDSENVETIDDHETLRIIKSAIQEDGFAFSNYSN